MQTTRLRVGFRAPPLFLEIVIDRETPLSNASLSSPKRFFKVPGCISDPNFSLCSAWYSFRTGPHMRQVALPLFGSAFSLGSG